MIPRIPLPPAISGIVNALLGLPDDVLNLLGQLTESVYSGIRAWLWRPLKRAINSAVSGIDDIIDALSGLPDDLLAVLSKLDNLVLTGVGLTAELFSQLVLSTLWDWIEALLDKLWTYIDEHWKDDVNA